VLSPPLLNNDNDRVAIVHALNILDTLPEERFDRVSRLASCVFNVPIVLISLVDSERLWFKSCLGLSITETPRAHSFCTHTILQNKPLVVLDASSDPRFTQNPLVINEPYVRFYAGHPLVGPNGHPLGTLCLMDHNPRPMSQPDLDNLRDLAAIVESELYATDELTQALGHEQTTMADVQWMSTLVENTRSFIGLSTLGGQTLLINAAGQRLVGVQSREEMLTTKVNDFLLPEDQSTFSQQILPQVLEQGQWRGEFRLCHFINKEIIPIDLQIVLIRHPDTDQPFALATIAQDIRLHKIAEKEMSMQKQLFENLVAVAQATSKKLNLEDTLQSVLEIAITLTNATHGTLLLFDEHEVVPHTILVKDDIIPAHKHALMGRIMSEGLGGWVALHRQAAIISDTRTDSRWLTISDDHRNARSVLVVPILQGDRLVGILTLAHSQVNHFTVSHLEFMKAAANQMGLAIQNAQTFEAQRRMAIRQMILYKVLRSASEVLDPNIVLQQTVLAITRFAGWPNMSISLVSKNRESWIIQAATGTLTSRQGTRLPLKQGIIGRAFRKADTQYVPDVSIDRDYVAGHNNTQSELAVPLQHGEQVLGVLDLQSEELKGFSREDIILAESLADIVALAVDNTRLHGQVQEALANVNTLYVQLQAMIESIRDGVVLIGLDHHLLVINAQALKLLGLTGQPDEWENKPLRYMSSFLEGFYPTFVQIALAEVEQIQNDSKVISEGEVEIASRSIHWFNLPVQNDDQVLGQLLILQDVTEERQVAQLRENLIHTMVHDLRNPLGNILGILELLQDTPEGTFSPEHKKIIAWANSSSYRMLDLVNAILDVSRLESKQMPLKQEMVFLDDVVGDTLQLQSSSAGEKKLRLTKAVGTDLPPVWVDLNLVRRILQNLVGNAIKFTPAGGEVSVTAVIDETAKQSTSMVVVTVSDTGPGISTEMQLRLFQKFSTGSYLQQGSGLGLVFCRLAVEAHDGRIWVERTSKEGTEFSFTLPVFTDFEEK
jgi:PAS domain S-box-containing protein